MSVFGHNFRSKTSTVEEPSFISRHFLCLVEGEFCFHVLGGFQFVPSPDPLRRLTLVPEVSRSPESRKLEVRSGRGTSRRTTTTTTTKIETKDGTGSFKVSGIGLILILIDCKRFFSLFRFLPLLIPLSTNFDIYRCYRFRGFTSKDDDSTGEWSSLTHREASGGGGPRN